MISSVSSNTIFSSHVEVVIGQALDLGFQDIDVEHGVHIDLAPHRRTVDRNGDLLPGDALLQSVLAVAQALDLAYLVAFPVDEPLPVADATASMRTPTMAGLLTHNTHYFLVADNTNMPAGGPAPVPLMARPATPEGNSPVCGKPVSHDFMVCPNCGNRLK